MRRKKFFNLECNLMNEFSKCEKKCSKNFFQFTMVHEVTAFFMAIHILVRTYLYVRIVLFCGLETVLMMRYNYHRNHVYSPIISKYELWEERE